MKSPVEAFDSGSNYSFGDKMERAKFPRSAFDLSHLITTTIDNCGQVQVLDVIETLPGDDHEINIKSLIRCLPQVVPLYSRQRIYIYAFWSRYSDLWSNFATFITKGYNGTTIKTIPKYSSKNLVQDGLHTVVAGSLADGLGIQQGIPDRGLYGLNCFDSMQLLRIYRDYFMNKNFFIEDKVLLPDDDSRFRLNDDGELMSAVDENVTFKFDLCTPDFDGYQIHYDEHDVETHRTFTQFCHDWPQDYFTSALPWPQRGEAMTLGSNGENFPLLFNTKTDGTFDGKPVVFRNGNFTFSGVDYKQTSLVALDAGVTGDLSITPTTINQTNQGFVNGLGVNGSATGALASNGTSTDYASNVDRNLFVNLKGFSFDFNQLRELAVNQTELEKMARTDGSFAEFGLTFFNEKSKNAIDYKPVYIGGIYDNIQYSEVLQTNVQYAEDSGEYVPVGSPLGTYGGHGIGSNNGYIGKLHCDDYGQIMILCCIMPDVYYSTGLERRLTNTYQSDMFLPERAKLGLRPILKKELFYSGVESTDNDLWAYQNVFDEYRYLPNRIKGKIADKNSENFYPYTQSRLIEISCPEYGETFAEAKNVRKDYLNAPSEVGFTAQFRISDRCVRALPYKAIPANILN